MTPPLSNPTRRELLRRGAALGLTQPALAGLGSLGLSLAAMGAIAWIPFLVSDIANFATGLVVLAVWLALGPHARRRLGRDDEEPEFSRFAWFSMLFAAGMGIGLMFYGVSEPMGHFTAALGGPVFEDGVRTDWAPLNGAAGDPEAARRLAMAATGNGKTPVTIKAVSGTYFDVLGIPIVQTSVVHPFWSSLMSASSNTSLSKPFSQN